MARFTNSSVEKQTIYEIYKACRLCGAGGGYKMPIIQNVVDLDDFDIELKQKIRECVQIEVNTDDKMPPLICELCVDKINDFYEFLEMCRQTNKRTRLRLGLPPQMLPKGAPDAEDCILGVTEPIFVNDDSDEDEPLSNKSGYRPVLKTKKPELVAKKPEVMAKKPEVMAKKPEVMAKKPEVVAKKPEVLAKKSNAKPEPAKSSSKQATIIPTRYMNTRELKPKRALSPIASPPPKRVTRKTLDEEPRTVPATNDRKVSVASSVSEAKPVSKAAPKSILKKREDKETKALNDRKQTASSANDSKPPAKPGPKSIVKKREEKDTKAEVEQDTSLSIRAGKKRSLDKEKEPIKTLPANRPGPASKKLKTTPSVPAPLGPPLPPPPTYDCSICRLSLKNTYAVSNHLRTHVPLITPQKLACNACRDWFTTSDDATTHHKKHRSPNKPYLCKTCDVEFTKYHSFNDHLRECLPYAEVPDAKCDECWRTYPTQILLSQHRCQGADGRPGGKCGQCKRYYALLKNLKKHESTCTKKKGEVKIEPDVQKQLLPMQIRVARCDPLLKRTIEDSNMIHYDVSQVNKIYGLDKNCDYPYKGTSSVKLETYDGMVNINSDLLDSVPESDGSDSGEDIRNVNLSVFDPTKPKKVESLSRLALKVLSLQRQLEKIARRRKKKAAKREFDSIMTVSFTGKDIKKGINNIIDNLGKTWDDNDAFSRFADKTDHVNENKEDNVSESVPDSKSIENDKADASKASDKSDSVDRGQASSTAPTNADDSTDDELDILDVLKKKPLINKCDENKIHSDTTKDRNAEDDMKDKVMDTNRNETKDSEETSDESQTFTQFADVPETKSDNEEDKLVESQTLTQNEGKDGEVNEKLTDENHDIPESQTFTQYQDDFKNNENEILPEPKDKILGAGETIKEQKPTEENHDIPGSQTFTQLQDDFKSNENETLTEAMDKISGAGENIKEPANSGTSKSIVIKQTDAESLTKKLSCDEEKEVDKSAKTPEKNRGVAISNTEKNSDNCDNTATENQLKAKPKENGINSEKNAQQEMEDKELMDALDEQIGESNISADATKSTGNPQLQQVKEKQIASESGIRAFDIEKNRDKSMDLDSISDDDLNFDA